MLSRFNENAQKILLMMKKEMQELKHPYVSSEHLLLAIMKEGDCVATRVIIELNVDIPKVYNEIAKVINEEESDKEIGKDIPRVRGSFSTTTTLNQFGQDITVQAGLRLVHLRKIIFQMTLCRCWKY